MIDAVGILKDSDNSVWLLLIRISLSKYASHKSKAGDLKKLVKGQEKDLATPCNWLDYY